MKIDELRVLNLVNNEERLELFQLISFNAKMSDLAIIHGGQTNNDGYGGYYTMNDADLYNRMHNKESADYRIANHPSYLNSLDEDQAYRPMQPSERERYNRELEEIDTHFVISIQPEKIPGKIKTENIEIEDFGTGIRPVIDTTKSENPVWKTATENQAGVLEVYYGEYPQQAAPPDIQQELEALYQANSLATTDKKYSIVTNEDLDNSTNYEAREYQEYITKDGKKYIRTKFYNPEDYDLSNNVSYQANSQEAIWVEVTPIKWYIDKKSGLAIADNILLAGCPFKNTTSSYDGDFDNTDLANVLWQMSKDIIPSKTNALNHQNSIFVDGEVVEIIIDNNNRSMDTPKTR